tara:strand:- start:151 stop:276 length:126 start_codon:yes stop_codon:yes gene_type:complete
MEKIIIMGAYIVFCIGWLFLADYDMKNVSYYRIKGGKRSKK